MSCNLRIIVKIDTIEVTVHAFMGYIIDIVDLISSFLRSENINTIAITIQFNSLSVESIDVPKINTR